MVELSKAASGNEGCTVASDDEIDVLLYSLQSEVSNLRYVAIQCLQELANMLPSIDPDSDSQSDFVYPVVLRIWVAKFDVDEETSKLAERCVLLLSTSEVRKLSGSLGQILVLH